MVEIPRPCLKMTHHHERHADYGGSVLPSRLAQTHQRDPSLNQKMTKDFCIESNDGSKAYSLLRGSTLTGSQGLCRRLKLTTASETNQGLRPHRRKVWHG